MKMCCNLTGSAKINSGLIGSNINVHNYNAHRQRCMAFICISNSLLIEMIYKLSKRKSLFECHRLIIMTKYGYDIVILSHLRAESTDCREYDI